MPWQPSLSRSSSFSCSVMPFNTALHKPRGYLAVSRACLPEHRRCFPPRGLEHSPPVPEQILDMATATFGELVRKPVGFIIGSPRCSPHTTSAPLALTASHSLYTRYLHQPSHLLKLP